MGSSASKEAPAAFVGKDEEESRSREPSTLIPDAVKEKIAPKFSNITQVNQDNNITTLLPLLVFTAVSTWTLSTLYHRRIRRISSVPLIPSHYYRRRTLHGTVTSVGDGDNFRLYHTPGGRMLGWGLKWLRVPFLSQRPLREIPESRQALKDQTIHVRLAGVDAPELPHFGHQGQPGGKEAIDWLRGYVLGRRVRCWLWRRDQYERVVATVKVWRWGVRRDVGAEMLRRGLATVYEARTGVEFGGKEEWYRRLEKRAKDKGRGIWKRNGAGFESPREFKTRIGTENESEGANPSRQGEENIGGPSTWFRGWFSRSVGKEKSNKKR